MRRSLACIAVALSSACNQPTDHAAPLVRLVARDYTFEAPAHVAAGLVRIRLVNLGEHWHHALLVRLDGTTAAKYLEAVAAGDSLPSGGTDVGGPPLAAAGDSSEVRLALLPGRYLITCWTSGGLHHAHIKSGMVREIIVKAAVSPASQTVVRSEPAPGITIRMSDYAFEVTPAIPSGMQTVLVENVGRDFHELDLVRLDNGATGESYWKWKEADQEGPAPGTPIGGTSDFGPGGRTWFAARFTPGRYLLICDMQMPTHHMMREIEVR